MVVRQLREAERCGGVLEEEWNLEGKQPNPLDNKCFRVSNPTVEQLTIWDLRRYRRSVMGRTGVCVGSLGAPKVLIVQ